MLEKIYEEIDNNNKIIDKFKQDLQKYYNRKVETKYYSYSGENNIEKLKKIIKSQTEEIKLLNLLFRMEAQNLDCIYKNKIDELKKNEQDKVFSDFYHNGFIQINNIDIKIDKFYIEEVYAKLDDKNVYNFICTDKRINNKMFKTLIDNNHELIKLYKFKNSKIFYNIYLDKELFANNRIIINSQRQYELFISYIKKWNKDNHRMVAETMIQDDNK